jgi:hypothetical protein
MIILAKDPEKCRKEDADDLVMRIEDYVRECIQPDAGKNRWVRVFPASQTGDIYAHIGAHGFNYLLDECLITSDVALEFTRSCSEAGFEFRYEGKRRFIS